MNRQSSNLLLLTQAKQRNYCQRSKTCHHCHIKEISSQVPSSHQRETNYYKSIFCKLCSLQKHKTRVHKTRVHKIEWLQSIKGMTNERPTMTTTLLLYFSTIILNLKTAGKCTAATDLTHRLSIHKTGNIKIKKQAFLLCTKLHTFYIHNF